ncbi:RNA polymerase sigma-70 factor [Puteibacter caeruleilacunae]|nr:RNA polymerase sigma-70 factor [Puteibacter caeruleilacunae]
MHLLINPSLHVLYFYRLFPYGIRMKIEDKLILAEIKKGNEEVFRHLFKEYHLIMLRFAEGYVYDRNACEDIVQAVFIRFWQQAGAIEEYNSIRSYLYKSVQNQCLNHIRDLKIYDSHRIFFLEGVMNANDQYLDEEEDLSKEIRVALQSLPSAMQDIFMAKYMEGKKVVEIAREFNVSENTVKTQLKRARKKMQQKLLETTTLNFFL